MPKFNFTPICTPVSEPTKIDLPHGLSLMAYISQDETCYEPDEYLLGDEWSFVRFPCHGFRDDLRIKEVFQLLGIDSDGTPNLESLLDNHTEAVLKRVLEEPFAGDFAEFQSKEQIEWLRDRLHSDSRITDFLTELWHTGLATDPQVVCLDVYSHSGETWSFTGQGTQCQWDTATVAGCLLPSDSMREMLDELAKTDSRDMQVLARENARDYLKGFNLVNQGEIYQIVGELVETATGQEIANDVFPDTLGGYLGVDHAQECFDEQLCSMKNTATEIAEARNHAWLHKLKSIAADIHTANLGLPRASCDKDSTVKVLAAHLQPPTNFEWSQIYVN